MGIGRLLATVDPDLVDYPRIMRGHQVMAVSGLWLMTGDCGPGATELAAFRRQDAGNCESGAGFGKACRMGAKETRDLWPGRGMVLRRMTEGPPP